MSDVSTVAGRYDVKGGDRGQRRYRCSTGIGRRVRVGARQRGKTAIRSRGHRGAGCYLALFFLSWRNRDWRLGALAAVANYGLQAGALSLGSVILVTGLQVTALLFALPLYARMTGAPVSRWDWSWAAILAAALAVVVTVGNPVAGYSRASLHTWLVVAAIAVPLVGLCLLGARLWPDGAIAAVLLAAVSGASLALFAVLVKGAMDAAKGGIVALLATPELYACIAAAVAGMVFQQSAYRVGRSMRRCRR